MTREEAIELLKEELQTSIDNKEDFADIDGIEKYNESLAMAIKSLEQEQSGDLISRQAVLDIVNNPLNIRLDEIIKKLPSVTQKPETVTEFADRCRECGAKYGKLLEQEPKTGHWIVDFDKWGDVVTTVNGYKCSECGEFNADKDKYCPNCGAKMVEPQESEE